MGKAKLASFRYRINNIDDNQIDDEGMIFLHKFTFLNILGLCKNKITEKGVQILSEGNFSHLQKLDLSIKKDNLGENPIGDEGIPFLCKFKTI